MKIAKQQRKFLVNSRYQLPHAGVVLVSQMVVAIIAVGATAAFYLLFFQGGVIMDHNRAIPWFLLMVAVVALGFTLWFSLRRSRRVAGLMLKIEALFIRAARGEYPERPLVFRKDDYFKELAGPLNACLVATREKDRLLRESRVAVAELLQQCSQDGVPTSVRQRLAELDALLSAPVSAEGGGVEG
jgi:hypothetical protein